MEHMINSDLVKTLRQQRSWTQDQLATVAGITYSVMNGSMTGGEAGIWYGCVGLFGGLGYVGLALLIEYFRKHNVGVWSAEFKAAPQTISSSWKISTINITSTGYR